MDDLSGIFNLWNKAKPLIQEGYQVLDKSLILGLPATSMPANSLNKDSGIGSPYGTGAARIWSFCFRAGTAPPMVSHSCRILSCVSFIKQMPVPHWSMQILHGLGCAQRIRGPNIADPRKKTATYSFTAGPPPA